MEELQNLFDVLVREGKYSKSFEDFQTQFKDEEYQNKVFDVVSRDKLYSKDVDSFKQKYTVLPSAESSTVSESGDGSLVYIKPKNDEEAIGSVKNIRKGINENSPEVVGSIAKEYFNLDNFETFRKDAKTSPGNFTPSKYRGTVFHPFARLQEEYQVLLLQPRFQHFL